MDSIENLKGKTSQEIIKYYIEDLARSCAGLPKENNLTSETLVEIKKYIDTENSDNKLADYMLDMFNVISKRRTLFLLMTSEIENHFHIIQMILSEAIIKGSLNLSPYKTDPLLKDVFKNLNSSSEEINDLWECSEVQMDLIAQQTQKVITSIYNVEIYNNCIERIATFINSNEFNHLKIDLSMVDLQRKGIKENIALYKSLINAVDSLSEETKTSKRYELINCMEEIIFKKKFLITRIKITKIDKAINDYKFDNSFLVSLLKSDD